MVKMLLIDKALVFLYSDHQSYTIATEDNMSL